MSFSSDKSGNRQCSWEKWLKKKHVFCPTSLVIPRNWISITQHVVYQPARGFRRQKKKIETRCFKRADPFVRSENETNDLMEKLMHRAEFPCYKWTFLLPICVSRVHKRHWQGCYVWWQYISRSHYHSRLTVDSSNVGMFAFESHKRKGLKGL